MIKPGTLTFLKQLSANNDRNWFLEHKKDYEEAKANVIEFVASLLESVVKTDPAVPAELKAKDCVLRIYRDVRFSKNKAPYKNNFGITISPSGKNIHGAGYYVHIQPGESFVAAGSWMPEAENLKAIRQEIDYNGADFHEIVDNPDFIKYFKELSREDSLKTSPKGYDADHEDIEYLKLKSFIVSRQVSDKDLTGKDSVKIVADIIEKTLPLIVFLRNAIA